MADRLFEDPILTPTSSAPAPSGRVARVVVDVGAIVREFDYVVPPRWKDRVTVGSIVRVPLHGRRVRAWVVVLDTTPPDGVELEAITTHTGIGPPAEVVELCRWAAWRWAGRLPHFLGAASPDRSVRSLPPGRTSSAPSAPHAPAWTHAPLEHPRSVVEVGPATEAADVVLGAMSHGPVLVIAPDHAQVRSVAAALQRSGVRTVTFPDGWAEAAAGAPVVVGARRAVLAPMPTLGAIVVVNEHDEALQSESSPTWHVRELAFERGRRRRVPVVLTSPMPTLEARRRATVVAAPLTERRAGWAPLVVIDRRDDDAARLGLYSEALVRLIVPEARTGRVVCVLNRLGRAGLVSCRSCRAPGTCARCGSSVSMDADRQLRCRQCDSTRPAVCLVCGSTGLRLLRTGVSRAREELAALTRAPVAELTRAGHTGDPDAPIVVGSEAALHQVSDATMVAFLEFDQELLAPRYRAAEQALALLVRASALVGGRVGRVVVQTQQPDDPVLAAAVSGSSTALFAAEAQRRELLAVPPAMPTIVVGGDAATAYVDTLRADGWPAGWTAEVGPSGNWLLRGRDRPAMLDHLARTPRPPGRLRLWVDPARLPI